MDKGNEKYVHPGYYILLNVFRPSDAKELFNLRHASLRNSIERIFGVLKKRFPILKQQLEYEYGTQVQLVTALCCLCNFIRKEGDGDDEFDSLSEDEITEERARSGHGSGLHKDVTEKENQEAKFFRDKIAEDMWGQYIRT